MLSFVKRLSAILFMSWLFVVALATTSTAQQLSVQAVDVTITTAESGTDQATFTIQVTNSEQAALANLVVTYKDGSTAELGHVPAHETVASQPQTKPIDASTGSVNIPIPVTLTYALDGVAVEVPWAVVLKRP